MAYPNQQQRPQRDKNILDDSKFRLTAPAINGSKQRPALSIEWGYNNPTMVVWTGVVGDKSGGNIRGAVDLPAIHRVFDLLNQVCDSNEVSQYIMENYGPGERTQGPPPKGGNKVLKSKTVVGRDKEGRVYIAVLSADPDRPKVMFHFGQQYYHIVSKRDAQITEAEVSTNAARGWVRMIEGVLPIVAATNWTPPVPRDGGGGGGYKGNSGGGYKGGGNNSLADADVDSGGDADLPF